MATYRTGAATYAIQQLGTGGSGAALNSAGFIGAGGRFGPQVAPPAVKANAVFYTPKPKALSGSGTGPAEGNGSANVLVDVAMTGRPGAAIGGWRKRNMPAAKGLLSPTPTTTGGFER